MAPFSQIGMKPSLLPLLVAGQKFRQIGFLVPVKEGESGSVKVTVEYPFAPGQDKSTKPSWLIQKQSGIATTPYTVCMEGEEQTVQLDHDTKVDFAK
jgi:hypothetical protein